MNQTDVEGKNYVANVAVSTRNVYESNGVNQV